MPVARPDSLRVELIARDFNRMLADLASIDASVSFSSVVDTLAVRVAAGALRATRAASADRLKQQHAARRWTTLDGKKYNLAWNLHSDAKWSRLQQRRDSDLRLKLAARGLAKQSWYHLGNKIIASSRAPLSPIKAPAFVLSANFRQSQFPVDVQTVAAGNGGAYTRTIFNHSPMIEGALMEQALYRAMTGETRYYERLCANRFYQTYAQRAARYPGIFARPQGGAAAIVAA